MFSKALFKQSCKANGTMWAIITFAVCFMLSCVMLISGSGNIGKTKDAIQDTIIQKEVEASFQTRGLNYYGYQSKYMKRYDELFADELSKTAPAKYLEYMTNPDLGGNETLIGAAVLQAVAKDAGANAAARLQAEIAQEVIAADAKAHEGEEGYEAITADSQAVKEAVGVSLFAISPNADSFKVYLDIIGDKATVTDYADTEYLGGMLKAVLAEKLQSQSGAIETYCKSRYDAIDERAEKYSSLFLSANMSTDTAKTELLNALSSYGVDEAKYESFGYTFESIDRITREAVITYRNRYAYEVNELGKTPEEANENLYSAIASSLLSSLPSEVSDALKEVGELDLYSLIVGSIFYKLAGLLLPIIYMIMASNNLIAGQVDRGSMAYVLSTSTKRESVVFTQAVYLIGSLFAMFSLTTVTGCICLAIVKADTTSIALTYGNLILLNVGAFLVLFALSGLCFFTSCYFDRSKLAMAIGGGLSIFALVAAMLGLFGTQTIPSVVRLDALNYFNYTTVITLFDVISIVDKTGAFIWKFAILLVMGLVGYVLGARKFIKKDLPL